MSWSVNPEPADETEREALIAALERALAEEEAAAYGQPGAWWRSGFEGLGRRPGAEQAWGESGVVEP